jgi:hypothetical protein
MRADNDVVRNEDAELPIRSSVVGDRQVDLVEDGVDLGRDDAHPGANLFQPALGLRTIAGRGLKQPSLAVDQRIEPFDVASQVRDHSGQLGIEKQGWPAAYGLETVERTGHLSSA